MTPEEFAATLEAGVAELRTFAEADMSSRCTVRRKGGPPVIVDGFKVPGWTVVHTDLPVRVGGTPRGASSARRDDIGSGEVEVGVRVLRFAAATADLADGDYVEVTSGETTGLVLRIVDATPQDRAIARRLSAIAVVRPKEWA